MKNKTTIKIDYDLKDILISAVRYMLGRKTIGVWATANYVMEHPELIDERVKTVMLRDLDNYLKYRNTDYGYYDDQCDYETWLSLKKFLEELDVK